MAIRIKDYSIKRRESEDNPFTDEFCTDIMSRYKLKTPDDEELQSFQICLEKAFRIYSIDVYMKEEKTPSFTETKEIYQNIYNLSHNLNDALEKLNTSQIFGLTRASESLIPDDLDRMIEYLFKLKCASSKANDQLKPSKKRNTKNTSLTIFINKLNDIYIKFTKHRGLVNGITKEEFCIECTDQAEIEFRNIENTDNDIERMSKLLYPSN